MIRKIFLGLAALVLLVIVTSLGFATYAYFKHPMLRDVISATTGTHPAGYKTCTSGMPAITSFEVVSTDIEDNCRTAAEAGDSLAQFLIGDIAMRQAAEAPSKGIDAVQWYERSAQQNNYLAMNALGLVYYGGKYAAQDYNKAFSLLLPAAKHKISSAQIFVAIMYANGKGTPQDYIQASAWLTAAIDGETFPKEQQENMKTQRDQWMSKLTPEQQAQAKKIASTF